MSIHVVELKHNRNYEEPRGLSGKYRSSQEGWCL